MQAAWNIGNGSTLIIYRDGMLVNIIKWEMMTDVPRFWLVLFNESMLSNKVVMRDYSGFGEASRPTAEEEGGGSFLRSVLIIEPNPIFLAMGHELLPRRKPSWNFLT